VVVPVRLCSNVSTYYPSLFLTVHPHHCPISPNLFISFLLSLLYSPTLCVNQAPRLLGEALTTALQPHPCAELAHAPPIIVSIPGIPTLVAHTRLVGASAAEQVSRARLHAATGPTDALGRRCSAVWATARIRGRTRAHVPPRIPAKTPRATAELPGLLPPQARAASRALRTHTRQCAPLASGVCLPRACAPA
jgi:hypothetical protein